VIKSHDELVAALKAAGVVVDAFTLASEGDYTEADAEWNYKDVPHLFYVHPNMRPVLGIVEHDKNIFISMQRILGLWLPFSVVSYHAPAQPETSFTTWLFYTLVVSVRYMHPASGTCRIETIYSVGAPKLLAWTLPIVRWLIKRNYRSLMEGDTPMRARRVDLRKRGYEFSRTGDRYSFLESLDITRSNVIPPRGAVPFPAAEIDLNDDLPPGAEVLLGDDGHLGLRLIRQGDQIMVFPRLCKHEGALLDGQICEKKRIRCPWHGRVVAPLAELNAMHPDRVERKAGWYLLKREGTVLSIEPCAGDPPRELV